MSTAVDARLVRIGQVDAKRIASSGIGDVGRRLDGRRAPVLVLDPELPRLARLRFDLRNARFLQPRQRRVGVCAFTAWEEDHCASRRCRRSAT